MREYSVVWLREGNSAPRRKRLGNSRKRAERYLHAVQSMTPEEMYGDKVDGRWCCEGQSGDGYTEPIETCWRNCEGKTWRERWNEKYAAFRDGESMLPSLIYARIESRALPKWEATNGDGMMPEHGYGEMIAAPEAPDKPRMALGEGAAALDLLTGSVCSYGPRWVRVDD